jgi:hypothetical protein
VIIVVPGVVAASRYRPTTPLGHFRLGSIATETGFPRQVRSSPVSNQTTEVAFAIFEVFSQGRRDVRDTNASYLEPLFRPHRPIHGLRLGGQNDYSG